MDVRVSCSAIGVEPYDLLSGERQIYHEKSIQLSIRLALGGNRIRDLLRAFELAVHS